MYKRGDLIEILKEFQDEGDDKFEWRVVGDEEKGRVDISPVNIGLRFVPVNTVLVGQIRLKVELIEGTETVHGGYRVGGVDHIGEIPEAMADEARQMAIETGRPIVDVLAQLVTTIQDVLE